VKIVLLLLAGLLKLLPILPIETELKTPPRIIRTCCAFGNELKMTGVPFKKYSDISSVELLGSHKYLGGAKEGNGIIYTRKGGFIDIGHLRDQADWTAYLYSLISRNLGKELETDLGNEGGTKILKLKVPFDLSREDQLQLAANIAYDLSIWHEIATFYGASTVPLVPERYSAFSLEDAYSNMLGAQLGLAALQSNQPFEAAMTQLLIDKLHQLEAVSSLEETKTAMELVKDDWWTDAYRLPSKNVLLKREFGVENCLIPWLVDEFTPYPVEAEINCLITDDSNDIPYDEYYDLNIRLNYKFPLRKLFPNSESRVINQKDFKVLIDNAIIRANRKGFKAA
jgi:hypothetical protein